MSPSGGGFVREPFFLCFVGSRSTGEQIQRGRSGRRVFFPQTFRRFL